jgi:hypothetical protein
MFSPVTTANLSISGPGGNLNISATEMGGGPHGLPHHHHDHDDCSGAQQSGGNDPSSAQGKIDKGNQLVNQGMQTGNWKEVQQGEKLINEGNTQLAQQQSSQPPCQPCNSSGSSSGGQSSNPLSMLTQALAPIEKMMSGGGGLLSLFGMGA